MPQKLSDTREHANHRSPGELDDLLVTHKSALVAELAQATANHFNNIMMAVTGYAELELKKADGKGKRSLEQLLNHATHATFLIQKLLDFSRARVPTLQSLELDVALAEVKELLQELTREHAELTVRLGAESEVIVADRVRVEQTLFALVVLARDAMADGGKLTVSTSTADLNKSFIGTDAAEPGKYVVLAVENQGTNASSADGPSLGQSQRVGLSLAVVRGIVKDCQGLVRFSSQPGASSFRLFFPASARAAVTEERRSLPRNPAVARTILVVEDDDAVRVPASEFLMMEGFKVLQARTGKEALNVVQQSRSPLDVLVADIFMPKMNGQEVAAALLEQHPDLKVLYISGDPTRTAQPGATALPPISVLRKPFRLNTLRDKIHDLLGE